jgi:hypothetical protein
MTDREALKIAFSALVEIDRQKPYPIAKHAIKCITAAFSTIQEIDAVLENERKEAAEHYLKLIRDCVATEREACAKSCQDEGKIRLAETIRARIKNT